MLAQKKTIAEALRAARSAERPVSTRADGSNESYSSKEWVEIKNRIIATLEELYSKAGE